MPRHSTFWISSWPALGAFAAQVATRVRLIAAAPEPFSLDDAAAGSSGSSSTSSCRGRRFANGRSPVWRTRSCSGASSRSRGYTLAEFLYGLGILDLTAPGLHVYRSRSRRLPSAVLAGILFLLVRRAFVRPVGLGDHVSVESIVIALFIAP